MFRGACFPLCSECGNNVRYRLVRAAPVIESDRNFNFTARARAAG